MAYTYDIVIGDKTLKSKEVPVEFGISENPMEDGKFLVEHRNSGHTFKVSADDASKLRSMSESRRGDAADVKSQGMDWG